MEEPAVMRTLLLNTQKVPFFKELELDRAIRKGLAVFTWVASRDELALVPAGRAWGHAHQSLEVPGEVAVISEADRECNVR